MLLIRPEHVPMAWNKEDLPDTNSNVFEGNIVSQSFTGKLVDYSIKVGNQFIEIQKDNIKFHKKVEIQIHLVE